MKNLGKAESVAATPGRRLQVPLKTGSVAHDGTRWRHEAHSAEYPVAEGEATMEDRTHFERRFDAAMLDTYYAAARLGYRPTRFLEMVQTYGGVETAHRLLATGRVTVGLG